MMNWIDWALSRPTSKAEIIEKIDNNGYSYPHYSRRINGTVILLDLYGLKRDCESIGLDITEVYPRQLSLF